MRLLRRIGFGLWPAGALIIIAGCAAPLPELKAPAPAKWRNATVSPAAATQPDLRHWWLQFNDSQLNALIDRALNSNLDIAAATERLLAARALYRHTNDQYLPNIRGDTNQVIQPDASASYFIAGFDALWEMPLFGAWKSTQRLASGTMNTAKAQVQNAYVSLVAEVTRCWIELRSAQVQKQQLEAVRNAYQEKLRLVQIRVNLQLSSPANVAASEAALARAQAAISGPQHVITTNLQQLAMLLGQSEPDPDWLEPGSLPQLGDWQMVSAPADMLRTRPEIASAEALVLRAAGEAGLAHADIFPRIGLGSSLYWSLNIAHNRHIHTGERIFSVGPVIDMPLFDWGTRVAKSHAKNHELNAAVYAYRQAVLQGVAEAETAMGDLQQLHISEAANKQAVQALDKQLAALDKRRKLGLSNELDLQDALIEQQRAQMDLVSVRAQHDLAYVALYKALGGAPLPKIKVKTNNNLSTSYKDLR